MGVGGQTVLWESRLYIISKQGENERLALTEKEQVTSIGVEGSGESGDARFSGTSIWITPSNFSHLDLDLPSLGIYPSLNFGYSDH